MLELSVIGGVHQLCWLIALHKIIVLYFLRHIKLRRTYQVISSIRGTWQRLLMPIRIEKVSHILELIIVIFRRNLVSLLIRCVLYNILFGNGFITTQLNFLRFIAIVKLSNVFVIIGQLRQKVFFHDLNSEMVRLIQLCFLLLISISAWSSSLRIPANFPWYSGTLQITWAFWPKKLSYWTNHLSSNPPCFCTSSTTLIVSTSIPLSYLPSLR